MQKEHAKVEKTENEHRYQSYLNLFEKPVTSLHVDKHDTGTFDPDKFVPLAEGEAVLTKSEIDTPQIHELNWGRESCQTLVSDFENLSWAQSFLDKVCLTLKED